MVIVLLLFLLAEIAFLSIQLLERLDPPEYLLPLGVLVLQLGAAAWWVRRRGFREAFRLKRVTWVLLACLLTGLIAIQSRLGDFYWTGSPLLFNLTAGLALLGVSALVVECRLRLTGRLLFRPNLPMHVTLATILVLIAGLNCFPGLRTYCWMGPGGSCGYGHTYGFPRMVASRPITPVASSVPSGISWEGSLEDYLDNALFLLVIVAIAGYGLEQVRRRPLAENRRTRRLTLFASLAVTLGLSLAAWPAVWRAVLSAFGRSPFRFDEILWPRMMLNSGLWTILFLIGSFGLVETLRLHGVLGRLCRRVGISRSLGIL